MMSDLKHWCGERPLPFQTVTCQLRLLRNNAHRLSLPWSRPGFRSTQHFWGLYAFAESACEARTAKGVCCLRPGQLLMVPPFVAWEHPSGAQGHAYIHFSVMGLSGDVVRARYADLVPLDDLRLEQSFLDWSQRYVLADSAAVAQEAYALAATALALLMRACQTPSVSLADGLPQLAPALDLIEEAYHRPLALRDLADAMRVSPQYCSRLFRRHLGESPIRYLLQRRVARAAMLLARSESDLETIAHACGFPNRHYLGRMFKRVMGVSPGVYRRQELGRESGAGP